MDLRLATFDDIPAIADLIEQSVMQLQQQEYTVEQRQGALGTVFGVDRMLIADGTYFVAVDETNGSLAACGGWSKRRTLFGSDNAPAKNDSWLDPRVDAARIRAFFVHPNWARRGLGSRILEACEAAAQKAGFTKLELGATLTGIPLYTRYGFQPIERVEVPLANGHSIPIVRMGKTLTTS
jgi:GNAT superfamily N-acetyltransferase